MEKQKVGQEVFDRFRDEFEQLLREKIVQELEQKYEEQLRAKDEEILKLHKENEGYKRERENYEKGMSLMKMGIEMMQGCGEKGSVGLINEMKYLEGGKELPPILQPKFAMFLPTIVSNLELMSFLRFIQSSKMIYHLAERGFLYLSLNLSCTYSQLNSHRIDVSRDEETQFFLIYKGKPLEPQMMAYIHNSPWIRVQIDYLDVVVLGQNDVRRLHKLLDFVNVITIENAEIMIFPGRNLGSEFLNKFPTKKLKTVFINFSDFLNLPNVLKVEEGEFFFNLTDGNGRSRFGDARDQKNAMDFILNSKATRIVMQHLQLAPSFVDQLAKMWLAGEKKISYLKLEVSSVSDLGLLSDVVKNMRNVFVDANLSEFNVTSVKNVINPVKPMVIKGNSNSFIVIKENLDMLAVFAQQLQNSQSRSGETAFTVTMKKIADE